MYVSECLSKHLPALEGAAKDPSLTADFLTVACKLRNRPVPAISEPVMQQPQNYAWPGNVRDLRMSSRELTLFKKEKTADRSAWTQL